MKLLLQLLFLFVVITTFVNGQFVLLNYYNYQDDQSCSGEIISTTYARESTCIGGTEYVCTGDIVEFNYYKDENCTQGVFQQLTQPNGGCQGGLQVTCVNNYQINENTINTAIGNSCNNWKDDFAVILSRPTNKCIIDPPSNAIIFSCSNDNSLTTSTYPSTDNCNGEPQNYTIQLNECDIHSKFNNFYTHICNSQ